MNSYKHMNYISLACCGAPAKNAGITVAYMHGRTRAPKFHVGFQHGFSSSWAPTGTTGCQSK